VTTQENPSKPYSQISLLDFQNQFPDEQSCLEYLLKMRWPNGAECSECEGKRLDLIRSRKVYECRLCHHQTSVTAGTIFHRTRTPFRKWFWAIFLIGTSKKGVPALYLQRQLGISYRAAWMMGLKIRHAMIEREELYTLTGTVQTDEIFIGGKQSIENKR
jgi:hypothetical protein